MSAVYRYFVAVPYLQAPNNEQHNATTQYIYVFADGSTGVTEEQED